MPAKRRKKMQSGCNTGEGSSKKSEFAESDAKVEIDGSVHEGGGQILRTAVGLACAIGASVQIRNIRAGRSRPGLRQQHVTGVVLAAGTAGGTLQNATVGSLSVRYDPPTEDKRTPIPLKAAVGSAGSTSLVLQAALPAFIAHGSDCEVEISGGTHVPSSPTAEYIQHVLCKTAERFNVDIVYNVKRKGFFPRGGGIVDVAVRIGENGVEGWKQKYRTEVMCIRGWVVAASAVYMHNGAADRMKRGARRALRNGLGDGYEKCDGFGVEVVPIDGAANAGKSLSITLVADTVEGGVIGNSLTLDARAAREWIGDDGKCCGGSIYDMAEIVGESVARDLVEDLKSGACVDRHMADQIMTLMTMAHGESCVTVPAVSMHMKSVKDVVDRFGIGVSFEKITDREDCDVYRVTCPGR